MKSKLLLFSALALCSATVAANDYPTSLYVIGDATPAQWNSDDVIRMVTVEEGVYEYTGDLTEGRMRFVTTYDFAPGYGPAEATTVVSDNPNETYLELTTGSHELELRSDYTSPDKSFKVMAAGRYQFRVDLTGETPVVEVSDATGLPDQWATHSESIYAVGSATNAGWFIENSIALHETAFDSGIYQGSLYLINTADEGAELKFMVMQKWNNRMYVAAVSGTSVDAVGEYDLKYTTSSDEDWKFIVNIEGLYDVTVDTKNLKMTISEPQISFPEQLWLVGPAVGGWEFDNNKVLINSGEEGVYSWTGDLVQGELQFFAGDNLDAVAYGAESDMTPLQEGFLNVIMLSNDVDNKFNVLSTQEGNYTLVLNLNDMTLEVVKNGTSTAVDEVEVIDWVQESYGIVSEQARAMALYDISGREVVSVNGTLLPFDGLRAGIYVFVIETTQGRATHKIVIR